MTANASAEFATARGDPASLAVTLPDQPAADLVDLACAAETAGFGHVWLFDSPLMDRDPYPLLAAIALATSHVRFGTCVTNPTSRDPAVTASALATLAEMSADRVDLGIGRGDSALRLMGRPPASLADVGSAIRAIRDLVEGRAIETRGDEVRLPYARPTRLPVWLAGYGPRALTLAARVADGIIIQVGDPDLVAWYVERLRHEEAAAGRAVGTVAVMVAAAASVGHDADAIERVRWFPGLVANHVAELLRREPSGSLPSSLTSYLAGRTDDAYIPQRVGDYSFIADDVVRRMAIVGDVDDHRRRVADLVAAGANQVNIYLERGHEAETIALYADGVIARRLPA